MCDLTVLEGSGSGCIENERFIDFEMRNLQIDHIIPWVRGGTDHVSNLQLLCGACNALEGTKSQSELLVLLTDKGWIKRRMSA